MISLKSLLTPSLSKQVFVGFIDGDEHPTTITSTMYWEAINPAHLAPSNIYVAQMNYNNKSLPSGPPSPPTWAPDATGNVRRLNPTDDVKASGTDPTARSIGFDGYLRFDLTDMDTLTNNNIARARLKICTFSRSSQSFTLEVKAVTNDDWTQDTIDTATISQSIGSTALASVFIDNEYVNHWYEFDVTSYVQAELLGDGVASFFVGNNLVNTFIGAFHTKESGNAPLLIIEQVTDPVSGAPAAPTGMRSISEKGFILLDWDDNTEQDFAYYNVYRTKDTPYPAQGRGHPIAQGLTMSEFTDISVTIDRGLCEIPIETLCFYTVTAVDTHGYESVHSSFFVGNTLDTNTPPANSPPAFGPGPHWLAQAYLDVAYSQTVSGIASDPDAADQLYFFKVSGPDWLDVAFDGSLSGTPVSSDEGWDTVTIQVNSVGGRDAATFQFYVGNGTPPDPPTSGTLSPSPTFAPTPFKIPVRIFFLTLGIISLFDALSLTENLLTLFFCRILSVLVTAAMCVGSWATISRWMLPASPTHLQFVALVHSVTELAFPLPPPGRQPSIPADPLVRGFVLRTKFPIMKPSERVALMTVNLFGRLLLVVKDNTIPPRAKEEH